MAELTELGQSKVYKSMSAAGRDSNDKVLWTSEMGPCVP